MYETGISAKEIGRKLNMHHTSVLYRLKQAGVARRQRGARGSNKIADGIASAARDARIAEMYRGGCTVAEIGDSESLTRWVVRQALKRQGVEMRRPTHRPKTIPRMHPSGAFVNYAAYREQWRRERGIKSESDKRIERMLEIMEGQRRRSRYAA